MGSENGLKSGSITAAILVAALVATPIRADDGRVPIHEPTTITQSGHYVLTANLSIAGGDAITIDADNVTLDLNGRIVSSSATTGALIRIDDERSEVTVRNGTLIGAAYGVVQGSFTARPRVRVEDVVMLDQFTSGIRIFRVEHVEIVRCLVQGAGSDAVYVHGGNAPFSGRITENTVRDVGVDGFNLIGVSAGEVRENIVVGHGLTSGSAGVRIEAQGDWEAGGNRVVANAVAAVGTDDDGIVVSTFSHDNEIQGNVVQAGRYGIWVVSEGNVIENNVVSACDRSGLYVSGSRNLIRSNTSTANGTDGIQVLGDLHLLDGNNFTGNGALGIRFLAAGNMAYRGNYLKDNTTDATGGTMSTNTDEGRNIP